MSDINRLLKLNEIIEEIYNDYGWIQEEVFDDESKIEEYKMQYIKEYTDIYYNINSLNENNDIIVRIYNV